MNDQLQIQSRLSHKSKLQRTKPNNLSTKVPQQETERGLGWCHPFEMILCFFLSFQECTPLSGTTISNFIIVKPNDSQSNRCKVVQQTDCQVCHPPPSLFSQVRFSPTSKGPILEQYLAEEALGLAKSLGWTILQGPFWRQPRIDPQPVIMDRSKINSHLYV